MNTPDTGIIDIGTLDLTKSVQEFEYTQNAIRTFWHVVESDDFLHMDSAAIFTYLCRQMKIVVFKDYLKRYIYRKAQLSEPFGALGEDAYREIIAYSFAENQAPYSMRPVTTRQTAMIKGWLRQDRVRRDQVFLLGFGLRMSAEDVSEFLIKALQEDDFHFDSIPETIYWYCYRNGLKYKSVQLLLREVEAGGNPNPAKEPASDEGQAERAERGPGPLASGFTVTSDPGQALEMGLDRREVLMPYLQQLKHAKGKGAPRSQENAYRYLAELMEKNRLVIADVEKILCSGIPMNKSGNLQRASASVLYRQFRGYRLSRHRLYGLSKKQVQADRYDLITLMFFIHCQKEYETPPDRFRSFIAETNQILEECAMLKLYPVNPYDAFVLMCLLTDYPLGTYAEVWEMSYGEV